MSHDRTAKDLAVLMVIKLAVIAAIYFAFFAPYAGRQVDTRTHLLGPDPAPPSVVDGLNIITKQGS